MRGKKSFFQVLDLWPTSGLRSKRVDCCVWVRRGRVWVRGEVGRGALGGEPFVTAIVRIRLRRRKKSPAASCRVVSYTPSYHTAGV